MIFNVLDHYEGFVKNNFIKKDSNQFAVLNQLISTWDEFNQNSIFFLKENN